MKKDAYNLFSTSFEKKTIVNFFAWVASFNWFSFWSSRTFWKFDLWEFEQFYSWVVHIKYIWEIVDFKEDIFKPLFVWSLVIWDVHLINIPYFINIILFFILSVGWTNFFRWFSVYFTDEIIVSILLAHLNSWNILLYFFVEDIKNAIFSLFWINFVTRHRP